MKIKPMESEGLVHKRYRIAFITISAVLTILRIIYARLLPLSADEAYFWQWSRHLDLCYYEQPPMIAYLVALCTFLKSNTVTVRLTAVVLSLGTTILVYLLANEMFSDERLAFWSAMAINIAPIFAVGGIITTTDAPLGFFWMFTLYAVYKALGSEKRYWWWLSGIGLGFSFLSKFISIFLPVSLSLFFLSSRRHRIWLTRKEPYLACALALLIFIPVIFWNSTRGWITFKYNLGMRYVSQEPGVKFRYFLEFLGGQALVLSPFLFLGCIASIIHSGSKGFKRDSRHFFLFFPSIVIIFFFGIYSLFDRVAPHWVACGYLTSIIGLPVLFLSGDEEPHTSLWTAIISLAIVNTLLIHILPLCPVALKHWEIDKKDTLNEINIFLSRWMEDLGKKVSMLKKQMSPDTFIICRGFALASYVAFYTDNHEETYSIGQTTPHGHAYEYWSDFQSLVGKDAIFVKEGERENGYGDKLRSAFERVEKEPIFEIRREGKTVKKFLLWRCYNFRGFGRG